VREERVGEDREG